MRRPLLVFAVALGCAAQETTAEKLIEAGHWKRARALVERRLRESPNDANAVFLSSQISNAFGDRTSPLPLAEKAVRLDGRVARYHRQVAEVQGVMAQRAGVLRQVALARKFRMEIGAALALDSRDVQALRDLLEFYLLAPGIVGGDNRKANTAAQQIAAVDAAEGYLAKARVAEFHKDEGQMEAMLKRAAEVRPLSYKAQMALADFYSGAGHRNPAAAEAAAKSAIGVDNGRAGAYCVLAVLYAAQANWSALEGILASGAQAVPDDLTPYYRAAERLLADGRDVARAERYLRVYLAQETEGNQPTAADAHEKLAMALRAQGQAANALR